MWSISGTFCWKTILYINVSTVLLKQNIAFLSFPLRNLVWPWQSCELFGSYCRWHGCINWLLGQLPENLELKRKREKTGDCQEPSPSLSFIEYYWHFCLFCADFIAPQDISQPKEEAQGKGPHRPIFPQLFLAPPIFPPFASCKTWQGTPSQNVAASGTHLIKRQPPNCFFLSSKLQNI